MTPAPRLGAPVKVGRAATAGVAVLLALAGCTTSGRGEADDPVISPLPSSTAAAPSTPAPTSAAVTTTPPASSTAASTTAASSHPASSPASSAAPRSTCTALGIRVIRGSASAGQEIAALQFVNDGTKPCRLVGYPSVTLLLHGKPIGKPSAPSTTSPSERTLQPGETAESLLHNYTNSCQAPLADSLRLVVPGSTMTVVRPAQLRACIVRVDRLGAPD
jgi:Protein of unknown function (DUF4232)